MVTAMLVLSARVVPSGSGILTANDTGVLVLMGAIKPSVDRVATPATNGAEAEPDSEAEPVAGTDAETT